MDAVTVDRSLLATFGTLFRYPADTFRSKLDGLQRDLRDRAPEAARHLAAFLHEADEAGPAAIEERYTRAFDLTPIAAPYLSVHLFGPEAPHRSKLMAGLSEAYSEHGMEGTSELPDHIALVLEYAAIASEDEWTALCAHCLERPLNGMAQQLDRAENSYRHLVHALIAYINAADTEDARHD